MMQGLVSSISVRQTVCILLLLVGSKLAAGLDLSVTTVSRTVTEDNQLQFQVSFKASDETGNRLFFRMVLLVAMSDDSAILNTKQMTITPGYDVAYTEGQDFDVTVAASKKIADGYRDNGYLSNSQENESDSDVTTQLTFKGSNTTLNGWFRLSVYGSPFKYDRNALVRSVTDEAWLLVHPDTDSGPFPDNFTMLEVEGGNIRACIPKYTFRCDVACAASANSITSLGIYKKEDDGKLTLVPSVQETKDRFQMSLRVNLNMKDDFAGDYVCVATGKGGVTWETPVQVMQLDKPANAKIISEVTLDNGDIKIQCQGSGSGPLTTRFIWGRDFDISVGEKSVISHDIAEGGNNTATIVLRPPLKQFVIYCEASNPGSMRTAVMNLSSNNSRRDNAIQLGQKPLKIEKLD
ncbi:hypothetical protein BaRGS_00030084 [Batillaria attramentaria]|uniref:Ig-like domain-containing protein n=1 Tax=Batillaria attramentaria TaxID=370345 RepID=A0ABD0JUF5_9CAEN